MSEQDKTKSYPGTPATGMEGELLQSILSTVPDALIVIDATGAIQSFSAAAERMFRYREADVLGHNVKMLMPAPDREQHDSYMHHYMHTGERKVIGIGRLTNARRSDGSTFPIELSVGEVHGHGKRLFTGFIRDLTERQRTERRLQDLQAELAQASRVTVMGTLASTLAHELNQPLAAIANYMEAARDLLARDDAPDREILAEAVAEAATQAVRAGEIIRSLREFIRHGEAERQQEPLRTLLNEAVALAMVGSTTRKHGSGIDLDIRVAAGVNSVMVNRIQIQQVITNLVRNAMDALKDQPVRMLHISAEAAADNRVQISVEDSGPGLSEDMSSRIFMPFATSRSNGMGLGLSISRTIVEAHGGRIWTAPSPLGGAGFHFLVEAA